MGLVKKWIFISDVDYWKSGYVDSDLGNGYYLVKIDRTNNDLPTQYDVVGIHKYNILSSEHDWVGIIAFDTEDDLRKYIEWIEKPTSEQTDTKESNHNVLKLVRDSQKTKSE